MRKFPKAYYESQARYLATNKQVLYIKILRKEAFGNLYKGEGMYPISDWNRLSKVEASTIISTLLAAKAQNWGNNKEVNS